MSFVVLPVVLSGLVSLVAVAKLSHVRARANARSGRHLRQRSKPHSLHR